MAGATELHAHTSSGRLPGDSANFVLFVYTVGTRAMLSRNGRVLNARRADADGGGTDGRSDDSGPSAGERGKRGTLTPPGKASTAAIARSATAPTARHLC